MPLLPFKAVLKAFGAYLREHLFGAVLTAIVSIMVGATGAVVVPPGSGTIAGWREETRDIFSRIEWTSPLQSQTVRQPWGSVELFWNDALNPSVADLQKAVLRTNAGSVEDFYFSGGDVVFVYRRGPEGKPAREADDVVGDRYYFRRGTRYRLFFSKQRMYYWIAPGRRVMPADHGDFRASERNILRQAHEVLAIARQSRPI